MSQFIYGTGDGRSILGTSEVLLRALQHVSLKALTNGISHFVRFTGELDGETKVNTMFMSPGVPIQFIYDGDKMPEISSNLTDLFQEMLDENGGITIPNLVEEGEETG